ncbi:MAG: DUF3592 domain-containing protein [Verrucomicrobiota bacterium]
MVKKIIGRYILDAIIGYRMWPPCCLLAFSVFVMTWQIYVRIPEEEAFRERGVLTKGSIIDLNKERVGLFSSSTPGARIFTVVTQFQDRSGDFFQFEDEVSRQTFSGLTIGNRVLVQYIPDDPDKARLQIREYRVSPSENFTLWKWIAVIGGSWLAANVVFRILNRRSNSTSAQNK